MAITIRVSRPEEFFEMKFLQTGYYKKIGALVLLFAMGIVLPWNSTSAGAAGVTGTVTSRRADPEVNIPENMTAEEVDAYLAGLSDTQVRQALAHKLKQGESGHSSPPTGGAEHDRTDHFFHELTLGASAVIDQISAFLTAETNGSLKWETVVNRLSGGKGLAHVLVTIMIGLGIIACGLIFERLVLRLTGNLRQQVITSVALGRLQQLGRFITRLLLDVLGISAFILVTFILLILIYRQEEAGYWIVSILLMVSYYLLFIILSARVIMSPKSASLRLLPLQDRDAIFLYRWIVGISLVAGILIAPGLIFLNAARSEALFNLFFIASGLSVSLLMIVMIWQSRHRVAEAICAETSEGVCLESTLRAKFARIWHYFGILYVAGSGAFWLVNVFLGRKGDIINLIASLFLIPIFIGLDQWVQRLLKIASGELPEVIDLSSGDNADTTKETDQDLSMAYESDTSAESQPESKTDIRHFAPLIRRIFRFVLAALLLFIVLGLWGIDLPLGRIFAAEALQIIMVLIFGVVIWEFAKSRIDRKLKEEMPDTDVEMEEGGAGGSRIGTLLLLLRKFIMAIMFVMVSLIVLSNLGVNIGPLIAGAGVIGLAIGFGAQTLVKDIISGIFFLIDDAFRVGDFIETAGTKGMVEHISLRSLRLRHPRGPVHTIPFGGMGTVTNNSRDYIISKLDFRVRYDTDVNQVRKIIKKINKAVMKDEEMSPVMLGKIKSQGVREMDDSAMIMRVKFKTIPGEQFVVRREVFRLMQESFRENGIEFAHRNVTVYLPPESESTAKAEGTAGRNASGQTDKKLAEAAAAAGAAAIQAEEEAKQAAAKPKK
jgi:small-conductance mechanosensitive channel